MAQINLLPWREEAREKSRKNFLVSLGAALGLTFMVLVLAHFFYSSKIDFQNQRNQLLTQENRALDKKIKEIENLEKTKADLLSRMDVIQQLQKSRPQVVHMFDDLVTTLPSAVYVTDLKQSGGDIFIEGQAQSNARVSAFMGHIDSAQSIGGSKLLLIENKENTGTGFNYFRLSFKQTLKSKKQ